MPDAFHALEETVTADVTRALREDVGLGDLTAKLIPEGKGAQARLLTRQSGILCGTEWFRRTFEELDPDVEIFWHHRDGEQIVAGSSVCEIEGEARAMLTAERTAMNFVQLLSGVATRARTVNAPGTRARMSTPARRCRACRSHRNMQSRRAGAPTIASGSRRILVKENHARGRRPEEKQCRRCTARPGGCCR